MRDDLIASGAGHRTGFEPLLPSAITPRGRNPVAGIAVSPRGDFASTFMRDDLKKMRAMVPGHVPPVRDRYRFEQKLAMPIANKIVDTLEDVQLPPSWQRSPRFETRTQLQQAREQSMLPHSSYDIDGDGKVGQLDYAIAKKHDLAGTGVLEGGQRDSAVAESCRRLGSSVREDEIGANARARRILTSLRDEPELNDVSKRGDRIRVGSMAAQTLKNRSSNQFKGCIEQPLGQVHDTVPALGTQPYTSQMLAAKRRADTISDHATFHADFYRETGQVDRSDEIITVQSSVRRNEGFLNKQKNLLYMDGTA